MEYKIVTASSIEELEAIINGMIDEGWEPEGGAQPATDGLFMQTMVYYDMEGHELEDDEY